MQVVKSRIQGATKVPGVVPKYNWTYPALVSINPKHGLLLNLFPFRLVTIFREEGPAALYKGFAPKVLRLAPGGGVLLLVVEFSLGIFRQSRKPVFTLPEMCAEIFRSGHSARSTVHIIFVKGRCSLDVQSWSRDVCYNIELMHMSTVAWRILVCRPPSGHFSQFVTAEVNICAFIRDALSVELED